VLTYVLGAPGSGKTTLAPILRPLLPGCVVIDWDSFMDAAGELAGRDIRTSPETWRSYRNLIHTVVDSIRPHPTVLLGVCTPDELRGWSVDVWVLLDCSDEERTHRLRGDRALDLAKALLDAHSYRSLGLPVIDSAGLTLDEVGIALAALIRGSTT
jgi:broad-specificity NMP kinase